jgi:peptidoglycan/xylan/chitin deacetylase (PgdA/CDA1 family)
VQITLCYHRIDDSGKFFNKSSLSSKRFKSHLQALKIFFEFTNLQELRNNSKKPQIAITFDDGYQDNLKAAEILEDYRVPATFFLSTYFIEQQIMYYWDPLNVFEARDAISLEKKEFQELSSLLPVNTNIRSAQDVTRAISVLPREERIKASHVVNRIANSLLCEKDILDMGLPMTTEDAKQISESRLLKIAPHTETHPSLGNALGASDARIEIQTSLSKINEWSNEEVSDFALPFGTKSDRSERAIAILKENGIRRIWTTDARTINKSTTSILPRLVVGNWSSDQLLRQIVKTYVRSYVK